MSTASDTTYTLAKPLAPVPPLSSSARRAFAELLDEHFRDRLTDGERADVLARIDEPGPWTGKREPVLGRVRAGLAYGSHLPVVLPFLARADLHPAHVARIVYLVQLDEVLTIQTLQRVLAKRAEEGHPVEGADLVAALALAGLPPRPTALGALQWSGAVTDDGFFLPILASVPEVLEAVLGLEQVDGLAIASWNERPFARYALRALERMKEVPPAIVAGLFRAALEGRKEHRAAVQAVAAKLPNWEDRVIAALDEKGFEVRAAAARWLGRARVPAARAALLAKVHKEKHEVARAAMMDALSFLGEPLDAFLDRAKLRAESEAVTKKLAPPAWLDVAALPALAWADTGAPVDAVIVRAWLASAHKGKSPAPPPLLRMYAQGLRREDAERFAAELLAAWIRHDTKAAGAVSPEAEARLRHDAQVLHGFWNCTEEEAYARLVASYLVTPVGSAIADKGLMAVVAALGGRGIAATVGGYLKTWYGNRAAHCKALLEMLGWIDDRAATQVLLVTSTRFRTAGIRAEAEKQVKELADRRGWTIDELADRTIPTAGLDDDGELAVVYGRRDGAPDAEGNATLTPTRGFTARIDDTVALVVRDESGAVVKALPDARKDEDEAVVKAAKADVSRAKKELTAIVKAQRERLYAAMCTQRAWRFEDWDAFLHRHPVARHLCTGVVWAATVGGAVTAFRPLGDGSLSTAHHDAVDLPPDAAVRVAHGSLLGPSEVAAWSEHLADFKVLPLFGQLARPAFPLEGGAAQSHEIGAFLGHMIDSFMLRGRAAALGYTRGPAEDGGWYHRYEKAFPSLGLVAKLEFSGAPLPEEKRVVALRAIAFESRDGQTRLPLGEVPPVLLAEAHADLADVAAAGTGFDPSWESKVH
jgi:hypothetical protein